MTTMRIFFLLIAGLALAPCAALATSPAQLLYWISMRGITEDAQPSYVAASYAQSGAYTTAFAGCNGHTFYLTAADAATVQAARTAGDTVQMHAGQPNTTVSQSGIICLIQADQ
jgi:hypothetical protein